MPSWIHDGLSFHYRDSGPGAPFVFQHGLGGDTNQTFGLFRPPAGVRLITLDCRGHGETRPLGPESKIGIAAFADDVLALMDHLGIAKAVVGGISMGAATALTLALRRPDRVAALVLSRPAWVDGPLPPNLTVFHRIARHLRQFGATEGLARFKETDDYREALRISADAALSFEGQFLHPRAEETVAKLERIPSDAPVRDRRELARIAVPALVLANRRDPIHPFEFGEALAKAIPEAAFRELTPKADSVERHTADVQREVEAFLLSGSR